MIATTSMDDMLRASVSGGRYFAGPFTLSYIVDPTLVGVAVWGRPSGEQILSLLRGHERMREVLAPRTAAVVDVRYLEWPDPAAFAAVAGFLAERRAWLAEYIDRLALVRPTGGPVAAAGAGFFDVSARPFAVEGFTELADALAWTGRADARTLGAELDGLFVEASGTPTMLRQLREHLDARRGAMSLEEAARALGVTRRSLQRRLESWETSFRSEQNQAQVRAAKRLLDETDAPLAVIAGDVGCASISHFSALFRRITGQTPSYWRKRPR